jgi:hypothetical protein
VNFLLRCVLLVPHLFARFTLHAFRSFCVIQFLSLLGFPLVIFFLFNFVLFLSLIWSALWHSCFRHCATSRQVAGSIPNGVIGFFGDLILGSTQPLTEISTTDVSWGKGGQCIGLITLPHSCADCLEMLRVSASSKPSWPVQACNGIALHVLL